MRQLISAILILITIAVFCSFGTSKNQTVQGCYQSQSDAISHHSAALQSLGSGTTIIHDTNVFPHYYCGGDCVDYCYTITYSQNVQ